MRFPKLRGVDVRPHRQNGHLYYLLSDPLELAEDSLLLPQAFGPLLALCDGSQTDASAISHALAHHFQMCVDPLAVGQILNALDDALLLENERSAEAIARKVASYRALPARPATHAGLAYPDDPAELTRWLDSFLDVPLSRRGIESRTRSNGNSKSEKIAGVFSPHIDYTRGGAVYARTWQAAREAAQAAELVILIGTDHYGSDLFTCTRQSYATPLGPLPTESAAVDRLAQAVGEQTAYAGELRHLREHALELVAVWLQHARRGKPVALLPVLVGGLHSYFQEAQGPASDGRIQRFVQTAREISAQRATLIVASGDLAHVGPAFGGPALDQAARDQLRRADDGLQERLVAGDADGFYQLIRAGQDRNNVCGVTPGYLALKILGDGVRGRRLAYDSCPADDGETSAVTIGGLLFILDTGIN